MMPDHEDRDSLDLESNTGAELGSPPPPSESSSTSLTTVDMGSESPLAASDKVVETALDREAALEERLIHLAADFENFRKRAEKEKEDIRRYGIDKLLGDLLPVLDSMDRAFSYRNEEEDPFVRGLKMVLKQAEDALARYGVRSFSSVGVPFDPQIHEAVGVKPVTDSAPGVVVEEHLRGYFLHDRLLRAARVIVGVAPKDSESEKKQFCQLPSD